MIGIGNEQHGLLQPAFGQKPWSPESSCIPPITFVRLYREKGQHSRLLYIGLRRTLQNRALEITAMEKACEITPLEISALSSCSLKSLKQNRQQARTTTAGPRPTSQLAVAYTVHPTNRLGHDPGTGFEAYLKPSKTKGSQKAVSYRAYFRSGCFLCFRTIVCFFQAFDVRVCGLLDYPYSLCALEKGTRAHQKGTQTHGRGGCLSPELHPVEANTLYSNAPESRLRIRLFAQPDQQLILLIFSLGAINSPKTNIRAQFPS